MSKFLSLDIDQILHKVVLIGDSGVGKSYVYSAILSLEILIERLSFIAVTVCTERSHKIGFTHPTFELIYPPQCFRVSHVTSSISNRSQLLVWSLPQGLSMSTERR